MRDHRSELLRRRSEGPVQACSMEARRYDRSCPRTLPRSVEVTACRLYMCEFDMYARLVEPRVDGQQDRLPAAASSVKRPTGLGRETRPKVLPLLPNRHSSPETWTYTQEF